MSNLRSQWQTPLAWTWDHHFGMCAGEEVFSQARALLFKSIKVSCGPDEQRGTDAHGAHHMGLWQPQEHQKP